ncbi:MAG TPA: hypothetical protein VIM33_15615 [Gaiellaceae bacterium]
MTEYGTHHLPVVESERGGVSSPRQVSCLVTALGSTPEENWKSTLPSTAVRRPRSRARVSGRSSLRSRFGCCDEQIAQLAEPGTRGVHSALAGRGQRPQRFPLTARTRLRRPRLAEHAACGPDRVERVSLAARAPLPPQPADLEHTLAAVGEEAGQARTKRAGSLDRERTPARRMHVGEAEKPRVALAARRRAHLKNDRAAQDVHDRKRVHITMRINTDHVVQLICKHHFHLQPRLGDNSGAGLEVKTASDSTLTSHAPNRADRLLIRPASGRQAGTGFSARTDHWKDTDESGHAGIESRTKSTAPP